MGEVKNFRFKTTKGDVNIPVKDIIARERIGDLEQLQTPHKDNLVNAINDLEGGSGGTTDYNNLDNKPSINGVTLVGNKTTEDLGIEGVTDYDELENKPTINGVELEGNLSTEDLEIEYDDILNRPVESGDLDLDAVVDPLPTVISKSNVVFDERGTEYKDGIYIKEIDSTTMYKPVYRKDWKNVPMDTQLLTGVDALVKVENLGLKDGVYNWGSGNSVSSGIGLEYNSGNVKLVANSLTYSYGNVDKISIYFTKTTDEWEEYEEDTQ